MKKIMLSLAFSAAIFSAKAQANQKNGSVRLASDSYQNAKEDPHNPLVNGIPYNQYKVQVQQENQKKNAEIQKAKAQQKLDLEKSAKLQVPNIEDSRINNDDNEKKSK